MTAEARPGNPGAMTIRRAGGAIARAPDGIASGPFWAEWLLEGRLDGEVTAMRATLDPGIRTHWHSHPLGQLLYILHGVGLVQRADGPVAEVRAGDSVWFAPDERHWHGAAAGSVLVYLSVQPIRDGTAVHWLDPV